MGHKALDNNSKILISVHYAIMGIRIRQWILLFGDIALLYLALLMTLFIRFGSEWRGDVLVSHINSFSPLYLLWLVILYAANMYDLSLMPRSVRFFSRLGVVIAIIFLVSALFFYILPPPFRVVSPKTNLLLHAVIFGVLMYGWRIIASRTWSSIFHTRIGVFDPNKRMTALTATLKAHHHAGYEVILLDSLNNLKQQLRERRLNAIIVDDSIEKNPGLQQEFYACLDSEVYLMENAEAFELFLRKIPLFSVGPHWFIEQLHRGKRTAYNRIKRMFDFCSAALILILTFPVWLFIAVIIKMDDGNAVFYSQERVGKNRKLFRIYKFRTMKKNAEANGVLWAQKNDPRTTRVGKILRRLHLDELPQMINILKGDISFVGPRPERPEFVARLEEEIPHYHVRHFIYPGFTGWAQVRFKYARSVMDSQEKFEYDLYYIKNRSLLLDLLIVLKSAQILLQKE